MPVALNTDHSDLVDFVNHFWSSHFKWTFRTIFITWGYPTSFKLCLKRWGRCVSQIGLISLKIDVFNHCPELVIFPLFENITNNLL